MSAAHDTNAIMRASGSYLYAERSPFKSGPAFEVMAAPKRRWGLNILWGAGFWVGIASFVGFLMTRAV